MTTTLPGPTLPIDAVLPSLVEAVATHGRAVLEAPPGAGKTTRVPLALLPICPGRIVMLEPRRLAARAAAERLAEALGEHPGGQVGYAMRGDVKRGTRIDVVTEGVLTAMLQDDPELPGVSAVIFDEFHERSLNADLGLALAWEARTALRPDLKIVVMSATLDASGVAQMLDAAPIITAEGRSFPVDIHWAPAPRPKDAQIAQIAADAIQTALGEAEGGILCFLPGEREIRQTLGRLEGRLPDGVEALPLYGALPFAAQRAATRPSPLRKIVLATSIAETSLTIEDIRIVIDAGLARRSRYDPGRGMARLVTERVSRAEAEQRAGRAGRVAPGRCYRLWPKGQHGGLSDYPPPEIAATDLASFALDLAAWGTDPGDLALLDMPPDGSLAEARRVLTALGSLDAQGKITEPGRQLAKLPLHPRHGAMLLASGAAAAPLAALLGDRDPLRDAGADMSLRLAALQGKRPGDEATLNQLRREVKRLERIAPNSGGPTDPAEQLAVAYPDLIAQRRKGDTPRFLMANGTGVELPPEDALAGSPYLVVSDASGTGGPDARIRLALPIHEASLRALFEDRIEVLQTCRWSKRHARVEARRQEKLGAIALSDVTWKNPPDDAIARVMCEGIRQLGLRLPAQAKRFQARAIVARGADKDLPDLSDETLIESLEVWLAPHLAGVKSAEDWNRFDPLDALMAMFDWNQRQTLDQLAPPKFLVPTGRHVQIDYSGQAPAIEVRLQEMLGVTRHPHVAGQALQITLLSPAGRPIQVTQDLPGFWSGSYADVRKDMRAQYPKHVWPEDPAAAPPTTRAKPRKS